MTFHLHGLSATKGGTLVSLHGYNVPPTNSTKGITLAKEKDRMEINGKKVVNATKPLHLTITDNDVKKGATKDPGGCAAARAVIRTVPNCTKARVHLGCTYVEEGNKWLRYKTPDAIRTEIISFDRGANFTPGEYTLRPMPPSHRQRYGEAQGSATNKNRTKKARPTIARVKHHEVSGVRHGLVR